MISSTILKIDTKGNGQILDLTPQVSQVIAQKKSDEATVFLSVIGSTAGLTTIEYEPGLVNHDMKAAFEKIAPEHDRYVHEETWHDDNGHSHVRASLLGPSLHVPVMDGRLVLGTWQQIILIDFDTRPRSREIVCQILS